MKGASDFLFFYLLCRSAVYTTPTVQRDLLLSESYALGIHCLLGQGKKDRLSGGRGFCRYLSPHQQLIGEGLWAEFVLERTAH